MLITVLGLILNPIPLHTYDNEDGVEELQKKKDRYSFSMQLKYVVFIITFFTKIADFVESFFSSI